MDPKNIPHLPPERGLRDQQRRAATGTSTTLQGGRWRTDVVYGRKSDVGLAGVQPMHAWAQPEQQAWLREL